MKKNHYNTALSFMFFLLITIISIDAQASSLIKELIPYDSDHIKAELLVETDIPAIKPDLKSIKSTSNKVSSPIKPVQNRKIVFIGNSKTYNPESLTAGLGIPARLNSMLLNKGKRYTVSLILTGGYSLEKHCFKDWDDIDQAYDVAFLQEQSDTTIFDYSTYLSGAKRIVALLKANNPKIKIYLRVMLPRITYSEEERKLAYSNGKKIAKKIGATPVYEGLYYDEYMNDFPDDPLTLDDRHQNSKGAYISALALYKALTNKAYTGSIHADLPASTARSLQKYVSSKKY